MSLFLIGLLFLATAGSATADADAKDTGRWVDGKSDGWFWYKSLPEPVEEEEEKEIEPTAAPPPQEVAEESDPGPAPLSSAWIRANIQSYLDAALDDPSPENVSAYLYIQKYAMDKSFAFMDATEEATLGHSDFDEINRRPTATFANRKLDDKATANNQIIIEKISATTGIFFFMDGSEASMAQVQVLDMLERNYQFDTVKIAVTDIPPSLNKYRIKRDNGHAGQMGVTSIPAIVLIRSDGVFDIISQAPVAYSELQKRILVGSKRLGVITVDEFNSTRPLSNIATTLVKLPGDDSTESESFTPIPAKQIINAFSGGMYQ